MNGSGEMKKKKNTYDAYLLHCITLFYYCIQDVSSYRIIFHCAFMHTMHQHLLPFKSLEWGNFFFSRKVEEDLPLESQIGNLMETVESSMITSLGYIRV